MNTKKKPNAYRDFLKMRVTTEQKLALMDKAQKRNKTFSEFAREVLLSK